jgi:hypothetical protein
MSNYYTTLEHDECIAICFRVRVYATKSLEHKEVWENNWIYEESTFWEFFKDVLTMYKLKLWHILRFD